MFRVDCSIPGLPGGFTGDDFIIMERQCFSLPLTMPWASPFSFFLAVLGPHLLYVEVPRLGVKLELHLLAYATAAAMQDA